MSDARLSVGFVSPFPPTASGIADYSAEIATALGALADVTRYEPARAGRAVTSGHDVVLFQIGNDPLHEPSVVALRERPRGVPAVVVLHDFSLHHLFAAAYLDGGRARDYVAEMERAHGARGRDLAERSVAGPRIPVWDLDPWTWPLSGGVVGDADAVIAHSRLVRGAVLRSRPGTRVFEIPMHVSPAPRTDREEARRRLGVPEGRALAASLGFVTPAKRLHRVLDALATLPEAARPFLLVGGRIGTDDPLRTRARDLGLEDDVRFHGWMSEDELWLTASAADLAVNLRYPTMGETSGAVCRIAGFGLPFLVSDVGWFRELPDSFATKAPVGEGEIEVLAAALREATEAPERRRAKADAAAEWGRDKTPERTAGRLLGVLREAAEGWSRPRGAVGRLALEISRLGVAVPGRSASREPDAAVLAGAAAAAADLFPGLAG